MSKIIKFVTLLYLGLLAWIADLKRKAQHFKDSRTASGYLSAVILLVAVMMATIIGAIVFFAFANGITGTSTEANNTKAKVITYAVTVFAMMAIVPLIMVGGLMLRSLGFMGGGSGGV
jgi:hypothetical protein